jgi:hypothetical protein
MLGAPTGKQSHDNKEGHPRSPFFFIPQRGLPELQTGEDKQSGKNSPSHVIFTMIMKKKGNK